MWRSFMSSVVFFPGCFLVAVDDFLRRDYSFNRVPSGPREQRGALPTRLNEEVVPEPLHGIRHLGPLV